MNRIQTGTLVLGGLLTLVIASSCGGSSEEPSSTAISVVPTAVPTVAPTATPIPAPTVAPEPTAAPVATTPPADSGDNNLLALGKVIFEDTGGGVGCAFCHGLQGEGDGPAGVGAPPNAGGTLERLDWALEGGETDAMTFIKLTKAEKEAVVAYLQFLGQ
jgi:mono/diheme cytochrome c family protein